MYVPCSGAVDIRDRDGDLVERAESGNSFGMSALLQGTASSYEFTAIEDSLVLAVPAAVFLGSVRGRARSQGLLRPQARPAGPPNAAATEVTDRGAAGLRTSAQSLGAPRARDHELQRHHPRGGGDHAAQGVSSLLLVDGGRLVGIVTDRDLRNRRSPRAATPLSRSRRS